MYLNTRSITTSKWISKPARSRPPGVCPQSHDYSLQVCNIMASKCISPNSHDHGLQVHLPPCLITASKIALSWPPSAYLQTRTITASKCISTLTPLRPPSSQDQGRQVHLKTWSITISESNSKFARSWPLSATPNSLDLDLRVHL